MQAIEFEVQLSNGVIQLPVNYLRWQEGKKVKVIVLGQDDDFVSKQENLTAAFDLLANMPDDFMIERQDELPQVREEWR